MILRHGLNFQFINKLIFQIDMILNWTQPALRGGNISSYSLSKASAASSNLPVTFATTTAQTINATGLTAYSLYPFMKLTFWVVGLAVGSVAGLEVRLVV